MCVLPSPPTVSFLKAGTGLLFHMLLEMLGMALNFDYLLTDIHSSKPQAANRGSDVQYMIESESFEGKTCILFNGMSLTTSRV